MSQETQDVATRQVRDRQELLEALALVHDSYVRSGYMEPDPSGVRLPIHYALPTTRTFVSVLRGEVIATISLFCDSPLALPMDDLYGPELCALRQQEGSRIAEVGMLADRRHSLRRAFPILMEVMKRIYWTARDMSISDLLITVNPKHKTFYMRMFCFEECGPEKSYDAVNGAPAVPLRMNVAALTEKDFQRQRVRRSFFSPFPEGPDFDGDYQMRPEDIEFFFLEKTDVLRHASRETIEVIESAYPGLHLEQSLQEPAV